MILIIRVDQTKKLDWRHAKSRLGSSALFPIFICLSVSLSSHLFSVPILFSSSSGPIPLSSIPSTLSSRLSTPSTPSTPSSDNRNMRAGHLAS